MSLTLTHSNLFGIFQKKKSADRPEDRHITRVKIAYIAALSLIATLSASAHFVLDYAISEQADSANIVNVAGRQRMLSQRIALLAYETLRGDETARPALAEHRNLMRQAHQALIHGGAMGIEHKLSPQGRALFFEGEDAIEAQLTRFFADVDIVLSQPRTPTSIAAKHRLIDAARGPLLPKLEAATGLLAREATQRINALRNLQKLMLLVLLVTLFAEAALIFRPLITRLNFYVSSLYVSATRDSLTDLPNRRHYLDASNRQLEEARRNKEPISVALIDLDHFKILNDTHGHAMGDKALCLFADLLKSSLRSNEVCGRIGGEEFAITLRGATAHTGAKVAERVRAVLDNRPEDEIPPFTISCGVAEIASDESVEDGLKRADEQLYLAKATGRNQVSFAQPKAAGDA